MFVNIDHWEHTYMHVFDDGNFRISRIVLQLKERTYIYKYIRATVYIDIMHKKLFVILTNVMSFVIETFLVLKQSEIGKHYMFQFRTKSFHFQIYYWDNFPIYFFIPKLKTTYHKISFDSFQNCFFPKFSIETIFSSLIEG